jgi:hypothetical protein
MFPATGVTGSALAIVQTVDDDPTLQSVRPNEALNSLRLRRAMQAKHTSRPGPSGISDVLQRTTEQATTAGRSYIRRATKTPQPR